MNFGLQKKKKRKTVLELEAGSVGLHFPQLPLQMNEAWRVLQVLPAVTKGVPNRNCTWAEVTAQGNIQHLAIMYKLWIPSPACTQTDRHTYTHTL